MANLRVSTAIPGLDAKSTARVHSRVDRLVRHLAPNGVGGATAASSANNEVPPSLSAYLHSLLTSSVSTDRALPKLLLGVAAAVGEIASILRAMHVASLATSNQFGDGQLNVDIATHEAVLTHLRVSGVCATASSEEDPTRIDLSDALRTDVGCEHCYSVAFDPLDGSSIIDANFAVGSIFAVFPGREFIGQRISQQVASAIALYGPRTSIIFALPPNIVFEATLDPASGEWLVTRREIHLSAAAKTFAPANLRCTTEDPAYKRLVQYYIDHKYTLRYSGGLVPDFYHALVKGQGVFISPVTKSNKAKLRLLYECAALAMISRCADGEAVDHRGESLMEACITEYDARSGLVIGSTKEVERYQQYRKAHAQPVQ